MTYKANFEYTILNGQRWAKRIAMYGQTVAILKARTALAARFHYAYQKHELELLNDVLHGKRALCSIQ